VTKQRETRTTGRPRPVPAGQAVRGRSSLTSGPAPGWAKAGIELLFIVACMFGVLEVHSSTDTWIGLAAGRQILTAPQFPKVDTFSYTFYGQPWFNQNWLSHVAFWLLYDQLGPGAVVVGTWAMGTAIFGLVLLATWLRCGSGPAAFLSASLVAIASREWLSARPATIQFLMLAALWLSLSALLSQPQRRRWWPVALLLPILAVWTHAHGSFGLAYCLVGLFLASGAAARILGRRAAITTGQALAIFGIVLLTGVLGAVLSPYGLANYTHPLKVANSELFREVREWTPPFVPGKRPPVARFWAAVGVAAASPLVVLLLRALDGPGKPRRAADRPRGAGAEAAPGLQTILFDVVSVILGLGLALFARRFAPVFYILSTPAVVTGTLHLAAPLSPRARSLLTRLLGLVAWVGAGVTLCVALVFAHRDLVARVPAGSDYNLLDRVTRNNTTPLEALEFLRRNRLTPNLMTDWKLAGQVMFYVPGARVFIDGRSQQLYSEEHNRSYLWLMQAAPADREQVCLLLQRSGTEAVLLPNWSSTRRLERVLDGDPRWPCVFRSPRGAILARAGSAFMAELEQRERAGNLWLPETSEAKIGRHGSEPASSSPSP